MPEAPHQPVNFSVSGFARLVRVGNLLIVVLTQYAAGVFVLGETEAWWARFADLNLFLIVASTVLIAAAGYIINDYYDVKIDVINRPERVVIDRVLKRRVAMTAHLVLSALGVALGALVAWRVAALNAAAAFLLWLYSNQLKRLPLLGNLAVALLTSLTLGVLALYYREREAMLFTFAVYAFFMTLIREIIKDMEDMHGDATFGCRTLPIVWGIRRTKAVIYVLTALFIAALFSLSGHLPHPLIGYLFFLLLIPISWLIVRLVRADTVRDFAFLSRLAKGIMVLGVLSMLLL